MPTARSGTCLMCGVKHDLDDDGRLPAHVVDTEQPGAVPEPAIAGMPTAWRCIGTGKQPMLDDGRDGLRRRAVENLSLMYDREQTLRNELERALSKGMFALYGTRTTRSLIRTEIIVRLWAALAVDGHYTNVLKLALGCIHHVKSADPIERGAAECQSEACVAFIRAERDEIVRSYADGIAAEDLAAILSHI